MLAQHYVYILYRPDGRPCYVGKGKGKRMEGNIRSSHNPHLARIINLAGGSIPCRKVVEHVCESEAFELECFLIQEVGRLPSGPLVNLTKGGDGVVGHKRTPEQLARMSAARRGRTLSPEARRKVSDSLRGRIFSEQHKAAISAAKKGRSVPLSESHKRAIGDAHRGRVRSPQELEAIRRGQAAMTDEARRLKSARITAALTGNVLSESHRASISRVQKGRIRSAEFRAKVSAGLLARHNKAERDARVIGLINAGLSAAAVGAQVGLSEGGVSSVLHRHRARARLAE